MSVNYNMIMKHKTVEEIIELCKKLQEEVTNGSTAIIESVIRNGSLSYNVVMFRGRYVAVHQSGLDLDSLIDSSVTEYKNSTIGRLEQKV